MVDHFEASSASAAVTVLLARADATLKALPVELEVSHRGASAVQCNILTTIRKKNTSLNISSKQLLSTAVDKDSSRLISPRMAYSPSTTLQET